MLCLYPQGKNMELCAVSKLERFQILKKSNTD